MNRSIYFILICIGCILSTSLLAQRGGLTRNPTEIGVDYTYFSDPGDQQILATLAFKRSAGFIPRFSPFITSEFLSIAGGIRSFSDQDSTDLRWRGTLYNGEFTRNILAFGLTLASFDESGLMQEDYRWAVVRIGVGKVFGDGFLNIYPQFTGSFGSGQWVLGSIDHPELGEAADRELSGQEVGFRGRVGIRFMNRILITGMYDQRILIKGPEPKFETIAANLVYRIPLKNRRNQLQIFGGWSREKTTYSGNDFEQEHTMIRAGIRFAFQRGGRKPGSGFGGDPIFD